MVEAPWGVKFTRAHAGYHGIDPKGRGGQPIPDGIRATREMIERKLEVNTNADCARY
jgi:hypothetical protein